MNSKLQYWKGYGGTIAIQKMGTRHLVKLMHRLEACAKMKYVDQWRKQIWPVYYLLIAEAKRRKLKFNRG